MIRFTLFSCVALLSLSGSYSFLDPGPKYPATKGEVWPRPQKELKTQTFYTFDPQYFKFKVVSHTCKILTDALERYVYQLKQHFAPIKRARKKLRGNRRQRKLLCPSINMAPDDNYQGIIKKLEITLTQPCEEYPYLDMDETYNLTITETSQLMSSSIWGTLRGLETFSQLFYFSDDYNELRVNTTHIEDYPRYSHRGLLLDTSRHYISLDNIKVTLDAMAYNKFNVFHWHIVDDQSFPYQSTRFPELSAKGAYHSSAIYTKDDIESIINYATERAIRVIPEFDVPGHTRSWGLAYPSILTECYKAQEVVALGPMDPSNNETYQLIQELFQEVNKLFPDKYFHVGGDEVEMDCWGSNPHLQLFMLQHNMSTVADLHAYFMSNTIPLLGPGIKAIVWQEVIDELVPLPNDTLVQVWKYGPEHEILKIVNKGYRVIFSSAWYLDHAPTLGTWETFYNADPRDFFVDDNIKNGIIGGEACMWGEMVDDNNLISRVWPRASAVAERLWSPEGGSITAARHRIEEQTCRLIRRKIKAQPASGPSFCLT